jgi:hypothetical protein
MRAFLVALVASMLLHVQSARAQEGGKEEKAPPPRVIEVHPGGNLFAPRPIYSAHGTRDVWNNYAVDSFGRWRPRVILAPFGSYYYYNGQPYPWTTSYPGSFRPVTHD